MCDSLSIQQTEFHPLANPSSISWEPLVLSPRKRNSISWPTRFPQQKRCKSATHDFAYRGASVDRNTATETQSLKLAREGRKQGRKPTENAPTPRKPTETQGPCPDLRGFCIKALTVRSHKVSVTRVLGQPGPSGRRVRLVDDSGNPPA